MSQECDPDPETNRAVKRAFVSEDVEGDSKDSDETDYEATEEDRLYEQVFSIPLILKEILKYLETGDLLRTSLLSRHWRFFSREVLRESKKCVAVIEEKNACHDLNKLNDLLGNSETVPFNGISIAIPWSDLTNHQCISYERVSQIMRNIINKIYIKYLTIDCEDDSKCVSVACIQEVIYENWFVLEGLRLDNPPIFTDSFPEFIGIDLHGEWLPRLRVLEFPFEFDGNDMPRKMLIQLLVAAPKLQEIRGYIDSDCLDFIFALELSKAVKEYYFRPRIDAANFLQDNLAFAQKIPQFSKFRFSTSDEIFADNSVFSEWEEPSQIEVSRILKQFLTNSVDSLRKVAFDHSDLILMTQRWNIPVLETVNHLSLMYCAGIDNREGYCTLKKIDWEKYFPNLQEIAVKYQRFQDIDNDFYIGDTFRRSNEQFVCESVKKFCWISSENFVDARNIQIFKSIFPNVTEFYLKQCEDFVPILNELWTAWDDLEAIYLSVDVEKPCTTNYDWAFLGISNEEATYVLENIDGLESLEIVSTKPSIFNLRKLKKLAIHYIHDDDPCPENSSASDSVFLSRLAGHCVFQRIPGLVVEFYRELCSQRDNCHSVFHHVKPFAKLVERIKVDFGVLF